MLSTIHLRLKLGRLAGRLMVFPPLVLMSLEGRKFATFVSVGRDKPATVGQLPRLNSALANPAIDGLMTDSQFGR